MKKHFLKFMGVLIMLLLVFGLSGCGPAEEENAVPPDENTVIIEDYKYQPSEITIQSGETVTWINRDSVRHTATGDSFDTGLLGKEEASSITFEEAGTFDYICTPHPYMEGSVIVE
ncbi:MAG TPA: cupredoxin family copper-binding protein [Anaerovoracaceae bacterium]|nr:cupredoxin family copper-binding protein [Anaerovoracaceae bacterium]